MMHIAILGNGAIQDDEMISKRLKKYDYIIAANGGLKHCDRLGITPALIIGDLDSTDPLLLKKYSLSEIKNFPAEKNETDMEHAINAAISKQPQTITLFAALGKRLDHALVNLHLIRRYPGHTVIETETERVFAIQSSTIIPSYVGQLISFIPLGPTSGVTSKGLKWELQNAVLDQNFFSVSNVSQSDKIRIDIAHGDLICCQLC